jgi:hypothetical protein
VCFLLGGPLGLYAALSLLDQDSIGVMPPKLASVNSVESLAIYPFKPTYDQTENHPYKNIRVNAREGE